MADYPSVPQKVETQPQSSYETVVDRAESGKPRFRTFYSQEWRVFVVQHECSKAEMQSVLDHFALHRDVAFDFVFAGTGATYEVRYAEAPKEQVIDGDWLWRVESTLVEV